MVTGEDKPYSCDKDVTIVVGVLLVFLVLGQIFSNKSVFQLLLVNSLCLGLPYPSNETSTFQFLNEYVHLSFI